MSSAAAARSSPIYAITDLNTLGGVTSYASRVKNDGQVVGQADIASGHSHAFVYSNGQMTDIGAGLAGPDSGASDINSTEEVVGFSGGSGFIYNNGAATYIIGASGYATAVAVNNNAAAGRQL